MTSLSEKLRQLAPHWAVMIIVMFLLLAGIDFVYGELSFWQQLLVVFVVAFAYPPIVRSLGVEPEIWSTK